MTKPVKSILPLFSLPILLLLTLSAPLSAQTGQMEIEPPEPPQPAVIQGDTPVAEPPSTRPAVLPPPGSAGPSEPAQSSVIQGDTPVAEPPPVLTEQADAELIEAEPPPRFIEPPKTAQPPAIQGVPPVVEPPETEPYEPFSEYGRSIARTRTAPPPHSSAFVFPAGFVSCNARGGYRKYDGVRGYQRIGRNAMFMYGGMAGKRFALKNGRIRFQAALEAGWGSKEENSYEYEGEEVHEFINLSTLGAQTDMHILFPAQTRAYFLSIGPGLHRTSFSIPVKGKDNQVVWPGEKMSMVSPSFNAGAGMEYTLNKHRALALTYNFRIWNPVNYTDIGDIFPMGVQYREFFYSHSANVQILLPGTKKGRFQ